MGVAVIVIPAIWLIRSGISAHVFGMPLLGVLTLGSIVAIVRRPPPIAALRAAALPAAVVACLTLLVVGIPQLHYGFGWLAFDNDDFTNYALDATRLVRLDEFTEPKLADLLSSTHPDEWTWFIFAKNGDRYGFDLLLAIVSAVSSVDTIDLFMSFMLAQYATLCLATTALFAKNRTTAIVACIAGVTTLAPTNAVAVYYQLGPQIAGLASLAATFYFIVNGFASGAPALKKRAGTFVLGAIFFASLLLIYPELVPVLVIALVLYGARNLWPVNFASLRKASWFSICAAVIVAGGIVVLGYAGINAMVLIVAKVHQGAGDAATGFNSTLTSGGIAALFGFAPIGQFFGSDAYIALALVLGVLAFYRAIRTLLGRDETNVITLALGILLVYLVHGRNGYGAFKAILYIQPFLYGTLADFVFSLRLGGIWRRVPQAVALVLCIPMAATLVFYIGRSDDPLPVKAASYTQIAGASDSGLTSDLHDIEKRVAGRTIVSDSNIESLSKIENEILTPDAIRFPSHNPYTTLGTIPFQVDLYPRAEIVRRDRDSARLLRHFRLTARKKHSLPMNIPDVPVTFTSAEYPPIDSGAMFLYQGAGLTVLNRSSRLPKVRSVGIVPYAETSNALVFVDSSLGVSPNYGLKAALFKPEPDYFSPGHLMAGVGRYLLFEIINPTPRPRLVFWFTRSLDVFGNTLLPRNITVYGRSKQDIALGGSGSARIVSQPLTPLEVDGHYYIALDLNEDPRYGDVPRGRLASLYNADLIKDDRAIDGFSRDISIVSERDARASVTPQSLSTFPADLSRCCVQYSGLYEDGWASQDSWFQLRSDSDSGALVIDGSIPSGISTSRARVEIDGRTVWTQTLYPGEFVFTIPLPPHFSPGDHRIGLHFDASRILGTGDARHASALLGSISFQAS